MTNINFRPIFPSPLGYVNFGEANRDLNKRLIEDIETEMMQSEGKKRTFKKNEMSWQSFPKMERKYSSFEELQLYISDSAKPILHESGVSYETAYAHRTEGLWANVILGAGGYSRPHIHGHGRTLWSGVYYPKGLQDVENLDDFNEDDYILLGYQPNNDGALVIFDNARVEKGLVLTEFDSREFYGSEIMVKPRESLLILFPVWLMHMVTPLTTNEKRYSISFAINKPM